MHIMTYTNFPSDWMFGGIEFGHAAEAFEWKNDIFCTKNSNFHEPVELTLPYSHKYVTWLACGTWKVKNHLGMTLDFLQVHLNGKKTFFIPNPRILIWTNKEQCHEVILSRWIMLEQLEASLEAQKWFWVIGTRFCRKLQTRSLH